MYWSYIEEGDINSQPGKTVAKSRYFMMIHQLRRLMGEFYLDEDFWNSRLRVGPPEGDVLLMAFHEAKAAGHLVGGRRWVVVQAPERKEVRDACELLKLSLSSRGHFLSYSCSNLASEIEHLETIAALLVNGDADGLIICDSRERAKSSGALIRGALGRQAVKSQLYIGGSAPNWTVSCDQLAEHLNEEWLGLLVGVQLLLELENVRGVAERYMRILNAALHHTVRAPDLGQSVVLPPVEAVLSEMRDRLIESAA